jgi:hypothetical protein
MRPFQMTPAVQAAANLIRELDRLKRVDAELFKAATTDRQRNAVRRAVARRQTLKRALGRYLSGETRAQRGLLPLRDHWDD